MSTDETLVIWTQAGQPASSYTLKLNNVVQSSTSKYLTALNYTCGTYALQVKAGDVLSFTTPTNYYFNVISLI